MIIDRNTAIQIYNGADRVDFPSVPSYQDQPRPSNVVVGSQRNRQWILQAIESLGSASQKVEIGFLQIDGKRYLAGMSTLPELSWYHLTLLDTSMLLPQLDFIRMVLVVVTSTLLLLAIMALSLHRLVLEPSARLADVVSRIHRGDYTSRPVRESSEEARELALKVRDMAAAIENTQHWLETEIEKRTHQLSDAREMLEISLQHERNGREIQANLMALMSHEMRSPVAVIGNTAQMLRVLAQSEHPDMLPRIEKIMRSVRQLSALMGTFLSEKWLDMDKHGPNLKPGNLNQVCAEIARKPSEHSSHAVRFEPWIGDTSLHADWKLIEIAITNLLDNARKYSVSNDEILLRVLPGGNDMLCLEVCNHGARIPPELQARIFEKYARGQHDGDVHGSGLGLYLVSWIAKFHGGYTEVSSSEGENNAFRLYLPRHDPLSLPAPSQ
jgi:signal transduction histidine kinase